MRIPDRSRSLNNQSKKELNSREGKEPLLKNIDPSERVSDIFNNRRSSDTEEKTTKLRLSYASKKLGEDLKGQLAELLKGNKELATQLRKIDLPASGKKAQMIDTDLRRLRLYLDWLENKDAFDEENPLEKPYRDLHELGADETFKEIYQNNQSKHSGLAVDKKRDVPNYYYLVYPEVYSFN